ncbi:hypothetical protein REC12_17965 [Desulfosporosinus sp. PR]|uniref:hypothetical protein n=1 Tax=Candidatus Desulfosporosinus nitrosoreducens TaxID=3401928 RepID=UPI0027ED21C3|nr:hypothetical protein [Desulfosporosinus sp. PR]MDQ7095478.1 hypothetical protein [Desulfosporosinus sp. PR]
MKVTKDGTKYRKLQTEGCLQNIPAEQEGYAEACAGLRAEAPDKVGYVSTRIFVDTAGELKNG